MRVDAFTLGAGVIGAGAAVAAVWLWTAPPPAPPVVTGTATIASPPDPAALEAALSRVAPVERVAAAPQARPRRDLRLIGLVETDEGRVAVIVVDGETAFLRPGDTVLGIELVALDSSLAVVAENGRERRLSIGG